MTGHNGTSNGVPISSWRLKKKPMTERDALIAAVIANPADDTVRLVFADWCQENGEGERAAYIRAGIGQEFGNGITDTWGEGAPAITHNAIGGPRLKTPLRFAEALPGVAWTVRRGFAEGVTLTAKRWAEVADELILLFPLQSVAFTTYPQVLIQRPWEDSTVGILGYERFVPAPKETSHPGHVCHLLWPSIPLAGWTLPEAEPASADEPEAVGNIVEAATAAALAALRRAPHRRPRRG